MGIAYWLYTVHKVLARDLLSTIHDSICTVHPHVHVTSDFESVKHLIYSTQANGRLRSLTSLGSEVPTHTRFLAQRLDPRLRDLALMPDYKPSIFLATQRLIASIASHTLTTPEGFDASKQLSGPLRQWRAETRDVRGDSKISHPASSRGIAALNDRYASGPTTILDPYEKLVNKETILGMRRPTYFGGWGLVDGSEHFEAGAKEIVGPEPAARQ